MFSLIFCHFALAGDLAFSIICKLCFSVNQASNSKSLQSSLKRVPFVEFLAADACHVCCCYCSIFNAMFNVFFPAPFSY